MAIWLAGLAGPLVSQADAGRVQRTTAAGLTMTIDARWMLGPGYRHVEVEFAPRNPSAADRTLTVEFLTRRVVGRDSDGYDQRVVQDVEIPAGSGPVSTAMAIPQSMGGYYRVAVLEDGQVVKGLSQPWSVDGENAWTLGGDLSGAIVEDAPRVLIVDRGNPSLKNMGSPLLRLAEKRSMFVREAIGRGLSPGNLPSAQVMEPGELPKRWIDYSNYDLLILSLDELQQLEKRNPAAHQAISRWTAAGGNLVVYGMGDDWQRLPELERLTGLAVSTESPDRKPTQRGWRWGPEPRAPKENAEDLAEEEGLLGARAAPRAMPMTMTGKSPERPGFSPPSVATVPVAPASSGPLPQNASGQLLNTIADLLQGNLSKELTRTIESPPSPKGPPHFFYRPLGVGMLGALASQDPFSDTQAQWTWVYETLGPERLISCRRWGIAVLGSNPHYWDFLIPGVGVPPVTAFRLLISVFVVLIGPVNYFLLRHWRRLHLLVVTIPATAVVVTGLLLAYALVADGLGTRVRARSFTYLDQRRGEAVCWARLSYYAGLLPQRGLTFTSDVVAVPLQANSFEPSETRRDMLWEDTQRLARGWLTARTPSQLLTARACASAQGIRVTAASENSKTLRLENRLGTAIRKLLVRAQGNRYYWAEGVQPGATADAAAIDPVKAIGRLRTTARDNKPEAPSGIDRQANWSRRGRRYMFATANAAQQDISPQASLLERSLAIVDQTGDEDGPILEPGSYVAIVDASPHVELGLPDVRQEASFHVIVGTW